MVKTDKPSRFDHMWAPYKRDWLHVLGAKPECLVRSVPLPQGYLWQHGDEYGFSPTLAQAKEWAEVAREIYPRRLRSLA